MDPHTDSFTTPDGINIHTIHWLPEGPPKAVVFIIHGLAEHAGRYQHVARYLVGRGYAVYSMDHRGHGRSGGERAYFASMDQAVDDLEIYFNQVTAQHPQARMFVLGHSLGSLLGLVLALRRQAEMSGFVSSGTPIAADLEASALLKFIGRVLNPIAPKLHLQLLDPKTVSRDPAVVKAYQEDPLVYHRRVRVIMGMGIAQTSEMVRERLIELRVPLLILHGSADKLTPESGSRLLFERAGSPDKNIKVYPGLYHEILNEPEQNTVLADITTWLDERSATD